MSLRVCFCTPRLPYPPVSGGAVETFRTVKGLTAAGHDVTVVTYCDDADRAERMEREADCRVVAVPGLPDTTAWTLARNVASRDPHAVMKSRTDRFRRAVDGHLDRTGVDVLHLHTLQMSSLVESLETDVPTVVRFTNVKSELYRQFAAYVDNPAKAGYAHLQYRKARRFEPRVAAAADLALAITREDADRLERLARYISGPVSVAPSVLETGVDPPGRPPDPPADRPTVTFFGSLDYFPNEDAAVWFADEVFPAVRAAVDDVVFEVVGKDPSARVRALDDRTGVRVTGFVDDIDAAVDRAWVVVVPVRIGTGVRIKLLHAMARGKAVVSTATGAQGVAVDDDVHLRQADDPSAFATAVVELLADPDARDRLGDAARERIDDRYRSSHVARRLERHYDRLVAGRVATGDTSGRRRPTSRRRPDETPTDDS